ncbi:hypothetical protein BGZ46_007889 [Entomortierella lignicola]|nr:hypothetical protein BGZ46_007889 [Entomortierella lignicola]
MSFNLGNNDRMPNFSGARTSNSSNNPLQQAVDSSNNRTSADMVLTPDHPSWHQGQQAQQPQSGTSSNSKPGSDSVLPQDAVPQGARFDPIVPDDTRQAMPLGGQKLPRGKASGESDFDELLPPQ